MSCFRSIGVVFLLILVISLPASEAQVVYCNGPVVDFEGADAYWYTFRIDDQSEEGTTWGDLEHCGEAGNYTGGTGDALCISGGTGGTDTTLEFLELNLRGITSASLHLRANFQSNGDRDYIALEIQPLPGDSWITAGETNEDTGAFRSTPGNETDLDLTPYVGGSYTRVRFRYYDPTANVDRNNYAQIDDVSLTCTGGADMKVATTTSPTTVVEGETIAFTTVATNQGPVAVSDMMARLIIPYSFLVKNSSSSKGTAEIRDEDVQVETGPLAVGGRVTLTTTATAGVLPEVQLKINSPASIAGQYTARGALFGRVLAPGAKIQGEAIMARDDAGSRGYDGCEPLVNPAEVENKILVVGYRQDCEPDIIAKHAEAAGAVAVVITENGALPFSLRGLRSFDPISDPIGIPSMRVPFSAGDAIEESLGDGYVVNLTLTGLEVFSQEHEAISMTVGREFDPDYNPGMISLSDTDNIHIHTVTVQKDSDGDKTPDLSDGCPQDAGKTAPGICGCGIVDNDLNSNGILDCKKTEEMKYMVGEASSQIKKLKSTKPTGNPRRDRRRIKAQRTVKKALRSMINAAVSYLQASLTSISLKNPGTNITRLVKRAKRKCKKAMKTAADNFKRRKKQGRRSLGKVKGALS